MLSQTYKVYQACLQSCLTLHLSLSLSFFNYYIINIIITIYIIIHYSVQSLIHWLTCGRCCNPFFFQVVEYGPNYPGYFSGYITVEGYTIPICFYWDRFGYVVLFLDGQVCYVTLLDSIKCIMQLFFFSPFYLFMETISYTKLRTYCRYT